LVCSYIEEERKGTRVGGGGGGGGGGVGGYKLKHSLGREE